MSGAAHGCGTGLPEAALSASSPSEKGSHAAGSQVREIFRCPGGRTLRATLFGNRASRRPPSGSEDIPISRRPGSPHHSFGDRASCRPPPGSGDIPISRRPDSPHHPFGDRASRRPPSGSEDIPISRRPGRSAPSSLTDGVPAPPVSPSHRQFPSPAGRPRHTYYPDTPPNNAEISGGAFSVRFIAGLSHLILTDR